MKPTNDCNKLPINWNKVQMVDLPFLDVLRQGQNTILEEMLKPDTNYWA